MLSGTASVPSPTLVGIILLLAGTYWRHAWSIRYGTAQGIFNKVQRNELIGPGRAGGSNLSAEALDRLLSAPPPLHGFQEKVGMLNPEEWLKDYYWMRMQNFHRWKQEAANGTVSWLAQPPPLTTGCQVVVNHHYRYVWIKTRKTGGTSMRGALGWICSDDWLRPQNANISYCGALSEQDQALSENDIQALWKDYFVFSTVRNPYSRFASGRGFVKTTNCLNQTFGEVCRDPFMLASGCADDKLCCSSSTFYVKHVREQTSCLFTAEGGMAVDFVARTETLSDDFPVIAKEINKRRMEGVPPVQGTLGTKLNTHKKEVSSSHVDTFRQYPQCIGLLDKFLENEFEDLQYTKGISNQKRVRTMLHES